jgi:hypothetical protein
MGPVSPFQSGGPLNYHPILPPSVKLALMIMSQLQEDIASIAPTDPNFSHKIQTAIEETNKMVGFVNEPSSALIGKGAITDYLNASLAWLTKISQESDPHTIRLDLASLNDNINGASSLVSAMQPPTSPSWPPS